MSNEVVKLVVLAAVGGLAYAAARRSAAKVGLPAYVVPVAGAVAVAAVSRIR